MMNYTDLFTMIDFQVKQYYDEIADQYDEKRLSKPYAQRINRLEQAFVLKRIEAGSRVLEVGPGTGRFTERLLAHGATVEAADISAPMLIQIEKKVQSDRLGLHHLGIDQLDRLDGYGSFDVVICMRAHGLSSTDRGGCCHAHAGDRQCHLRHGTARRRMGVGRRTTQRRGAG